MKKVLVSIIVALLVLTAVFAFACSSDPVVASGEYTIVSPDGAPALALASLAQNPQISDTLKVTPSIVASSLIAAEAIKSDFAILPANAAANLYNKGQEYKLVASVTNGNMFIVSNVENASFTLDDLKGKMLYSIGQGSIPAFVLLNILTNAGIEYVVSETPVEGKVAIQYCLEGKDLIAKIKTASGTVYGNLAEPAVTSLCANGGYRVADVQELWKTSTSSEIKGFAQAVLIAKKSICENNPEVVDALLAALVANETYVVENVKASKDAIVAIYPESSLSSLPEVAQVVRNCNVKIYRASENYDYIYNTLNAAYTINAAAVGGSIPAKDSGFYY